MDGREYKLAHPTPSNTLRFDARSAVEEKRSPARSYCLIFLKKAQFPAGSC